MSGSDRFDAGYEWASKHIKSLTNELKEGEAFNIVTHSEGAAYGSGIAKYLIENHYKVNMILHLSADEGDEFTTPKEPFTLQLSYDKDWVTKNHKIDNVDKFGIISSDGFGMDEVHGATKSSNVFKHASDLITVRSQQAIGMRNGKYALWYYQDSKTTPNNTQFVQINDAKLSNEDGTSKY